MNLLFGLERGQLTEHSQVGELCRALEEFGAQVSYAWIDLPAGPGHSVRIEGGKTIWQGNLVVGAPHRHIVFGENSVFMNLKQIELAIPYLESKKFELFGHLLFRSDIHYGKETIVHLLHLTFETGEPIKVEQEMQKFTEQKEDV